MVFETIWRIRHLRGHEAGRDLRDRHARARVGLAAERVAGRAGNLQANTGTENQY
jgi:hypothetical protein